MKKYVHSLRLAVAALASLLVSVVVAGFSSGTPMAGALPPYGRGFSVPNHGSAVSVHASGSPLAGILYVVFLLVAIAVAIGLDHVSWHRTKTAPDAAPASVHLVPRPHTGPRPAA